MAYLAWAGEKTFMHYNSVFMNGITSSIAAKEVSIGNTEADVHASRKNLLATLQTALQTASRAGIKEYSVPQRSISAGTTVAVANNTQPYMLGTQYLGAQLDTQKRAPLIYPTSYYLNKLEPERVRPLLTADATATPYAFIQSPTLPLRRDKPKRSLSVVLALFLGALVGCAWILIGDAIRDHRARADASKLPVMGPPSSGYNPQPMTERAEEEDRFRRDNSTDVGRKSASESVER